MDDAAAVVVALGAVVLVELADDAVEDGMLATAEVGPGEGEEMGAAYGFRMESKTSRHRVLAIDRGMAGREPDLCS